MKTATSTGGVVGQDRLISIHAVMKTATWNIEVNIFELKDFNPCSHEDCNSGWACCRYAKNISIHAVMKTATR